jgi:diguanylate cyclase (GGDEF)-like protein
VAGVLLSGTLIAALGWYIAHTQAQSRDALRDGLERRAALTARLVSGAFVAATGPDQIGERYSGSPVDVRRAVADGSDPATKRTIVFAADGRVIAASPRELAEDDELIARNPHLRAALEGRTSLSDAFHDHERGWQIEIAVPLETPFGRRVVAGSGPVQIVDDFAGGFFATASALRGSQGYVIDGNGRVLSSTATATPAEARIDAGLAQALGDSMAGTYGDRTFVSARAPSSAWRVVLSVPTSNLYASVDGRPRLVAWGLFGAFAVAVFGLLAIGVAAVGGARRLTESRDRERVARQLAHERLHDALTGLPNRALFEDRAEHAISAARRARRAVAVVFLDIDNFKRVNDSLGHATGDAVLEEVAQRLRSSFRASDTVSRFGGDEFIALCEDVDDRALLRLVSRMQQELQRPVCLDAREVPVSFSVGVAVHGPDDPPRTAAALLQDADTAMYRVKASGRGRIEVFNADLQREALERLDAEVALRRAIEDDGLSIHYQPIVTLPEGRIHGVEALARWRRADTGQMVAPAEFIPLAEETGLIIGLGAWVLRTAVGDVADWQRRGIVCEDFRLSINVSARQLADPGLAGTVAEALTRWALPAGNLILEITETAVMADPSAAGQMLERLDALGVQLALDDFGVGHSSLGQLARALPISMLKLDRSFVAGMTDERDRGIVQAAAALSDALDLDSVAEGVETSQQAGALAEMGFHYAQGFHFGRPADRDSTARLLRAGSAAELETADNQA